MQAPQEQKREKVQKLAEEKASFFLFLFFISYSHALID